MQLRYQEKKIKCLGQIRGLLPELAGFCGLPSVDSRYLVRDSIPTQHISGSGVFKQCNSQFLKGGHRYLSEKEWKGRTTKHLAEKNRTSSAEPMLPLIGTKRPKVKQHVKNSADFLFWKRNRRSCCFFLCEQRNFAWNDRFVSALLSVVRWHSSWADTWERGGVLSLPAMALICLLKQNTDCPVHPTGGGGGWPQGFRISRPECIATGKKKLCAKTNFIPQMIWHPRCCFICGLSQLGGGHLFHRWSGTLRRLSV